MSLPSNITALIRSMSQYDAETSEAVKAFSMSRADKFNSVEQMELVAASLLPSTRMAIDRAICDCYKDGRQGIPPSADEVIIGGGLHAAIYCASRVARGFPKPVVLDTNPLEYVGGTFAMTKAGGFYLNQLNRPGQIGLPYNMQALQYLPGAFIQPADISLAEYQPNSDLGYIVRLTLAMYGRVFGNCEVTEADISFSNSLLYTSTGYSIGAKRVIDARGLGNLPKGPVLPNGTSIMSFNQFMRRMDTPFPFQGMQRVAVIGGGDSGNVTVESLLGVGPTSGMSTASLDYVPVIEWYGTRLPQLCKDWRKTVRGRYARIGNYLPRRVSERRPRVRTIPERARIVETADGVVVNGQTYDTAILATGTTRPILLGMSDGGFSTYELNGYPIAQNYGGYNVYRIGPACDLDFTTSEFRNDVAALQANKVAIFRYASRTSALATSLPDVI